MKAGVGFSTHSGWAVAVVAHIDRAGHLRVVDRRRVELIDGDLPRQAYHAAAALDSVSAAALVARVETAIAAHARDVLTEIRGAIGDVSIAAVAVVGEPREIPDVDLVLASHARMHACEGEQYRRGIVEAANDLGVPAVRVGRAGLTRVSELLDWNPQRTRRELVAVRAELGPPWQKDHNQAALAALAAVYL